MHPTMMLTLAKEIKAERHDQWQKAPVRSQTLAESPHTPSTARAASVARQLVAAIRLWPRLS
jgi:transposase